MDIYINDSYCLCISDRFIYSLTKADKEELIKEVTRAVESDQFLVNAIMDDKITNIHYKREENLFGEFDLYGDAFVNQMYDYHYLKCRVSCCNKYWEQIEITPVTIWNCSF